MANKLDLYRPNHSKRPYIAAVLIALDQLANTLLRGYVDETLSSRAHRCRNKRRWEITEQFIDGMFFWDRQGEIRHCELAYYGELVREHFPQAGVTST